MKKILIIILTLFILLGSGLFNINYVAYAEEEVESEEEIPEYKFETISYNWNVEKELKYLENKKDPQLARDLSSLFTPLGLIYAEADIANTVMHTGIELMSAGAISHSFFISDEDTNLFDFFPILIFGINRLTARSLAKREAKISNTKLKHRIRIDKKFNDDTENESIDMKWEINY